LFPIKNEISSYKEQRKWDFTKKDSSKRNNRLHFCINLIADFDKINSFPHSIATCVLVSNPEFDKNK